MYSVNIPSKPILMPKIRRHDENKRHPPLLSIKYTAATIKIPNIILLMLKISADGSTRGIVPPRSLKLFNAML